MPKRRKWGATRAMVRETVMEEYQRAGTVPSRAVLSQQLGIPPDTLKRYLQELRKEGLLPPPGLSKLRSVVPVKKEKKPRAKRVVSGSPPVAEGNTSAMLVLDPVTGKVGLFEGIMKSLGKIAELRNWGMMQNIKGLPVVGVIRDNGVFSGENEEAKR